MHLPLRIDRFEEKIIAAMTPNLVGGVERPHLYFMGDAKFEIYAMTDEEAETMRDIVTNVKIQALYDETISMILYETVGPFFAGTGTAESTVRILQNRVQTYLDERG